MPESRVAPASTAAPVLGTPKGLPIFVRDSAEREDIISRHPDAALVAEWLPLRANLTVIENIALVPQFRLGLSFDDAAAMGLRLLALAGRTECAALRDPDISREDRFVTKLVRGVLMTKPIILVDRPALQLPDIPYPEFLESVLAPLAGEYRNCSILDYAWNAPLYDRPDSDTSG